MRYAFPPYLSPADIPITHCVRWLWLTTHLWQIPSGFFMLRLFPISAAGIIGGSRATPTGARLVSRPARR